MYFPILNGERLKNAQNSQNHKGLSGWFLFDARVGGKKNPAEKKIELTSRVGEGKWFAVNI